MNCHLCGREAELCRSHVIPEFLYETLYDEKHRFHQIHVNPERPNQFKQKGLREPLLCEPCEQKLSVQEQYVSRLLNGGAPLVVRQDGMYLHLSEVDYAKLKLFQLSVLWRAGISSLPHFSQVQLGPHADRLRQMIRSNSPGEAATYGCIMSLLMQGNSMVTDLIVPPTWARFVGLKAYRFVCGGLVLLYIVSSSAPPDFAVQHYAQPNGTVIVRLQPIEEMGFLMDTFTKLVGQGKL
jgi:hypothetical protein